MIRAVLFADGGAAGFFQDGTALVLDSRMHWALVVGPDGSEYRALAQHCAESLAPKLAAVLAFRNRHSERPPVIYTRFVDAGAAFELVGEHTHACWGEAPEEAEAERVEDGSWSVRSQEALASLTLSANRKLVHVRWPALTAASRGRHAAQYLWQEQVFPLESLPECWAHPARLALLAAGAPVPPALEAGAARAERIATSTVLTELPRAASGGPPAPPNFPSAASIAVLQPPRRAPREGAEAELGLPPHPPVLVDWTPEATFWYLPATGAALALLAGGGGCVEATPCGGFVQLLRPGGEPALFAAGAAPPHAAAAARRLLTFRRACALAWSVVPAPAPAPPSAPPLPPVRCALAPGRRPGRDRRGGVVAWRRPGVREVAEEVEVEGVGRLVAYRDGRVRGRFLDRTLLSMAPDGACELVLPDGRALRAHAARPSTPTRAPPAPAPPLGRFADGAQREAAREAARRAVAAELGKIERFIEIGRIARGALAS
eukprot:tig00000983_g5911.t1